MNHGVTHTPNFCPVHEELEGTIEVEGTLVCEKCSQAQW